MARVTKKAGTARKAAKRATKRTAKATRKTAAKKAAPKKAARKSTAKAAKKATSRRIPTRKIPGISRVDQDSTRTHGWVVRLNYQQTANGWRPKHTAYFGDATHGGPTKSMAAAEEYLKKLQKSDKRSR